MSAWTKTSETPIRIYIYINTTEASKQRRERTTYKLSSYICVGSSVSRFDAV